MNKRLVVILTICFVCLLSLVFIGYKTLNDYTIIIKLNWGLELPKKAKIKETYESDSGANFNGDGWRYHIFQYKNEDPIIKELDWDNDEKETIFDSSYRESVNNWLSKINVPSEKYPEYDKCLYIYKNKEDTSEIILLLDITKKRIYVAEQIN